MSEFQDPPEPPRIPVEVLSECRESGNYCPVLFEWYKYVSQLSNFFARIRPDSPAVRDINPIHYAVLVGLLNRCSRLMFANVVLSHKGLFGETTALIDRCIFESCVKAAWLCAKSSEEKFTRYLADGLKSELELRGEIQKKIESRDGKPVLRIEERMLVSIADYIASSGLSDTEIASAKKLPDLAAMIQDLGQDRLMYVVGQRIGSHHVHGTWPCLRSHYLEEREGMLSPRDHDCETHVNQYIATPLFLLDTLRQFVRFAFRENEDMVSAERLLEFAEREISSLNDELIGQDFVNGLGHR